MPGTASTRSTGKGEGKQMNKDTVIALARECGLPDWELVGVKLERFAALVAAHEREACAKVCEELTLAHPGRADLTADQCAAAIRSRT